MGWTAVATELGTQAYLAGLKAAEGRLSKRRYKRLIASTVAQVLELHPDLGSKKARRLAEKVTGVAPSKKLIKAKKPIGVREGAQAAAAALIAGGALKAARAVGGKLAAGGPTRRRSSSAKPTRRPTVGSRAAAADSTESSPSGPAAAEATHSVPGSSPG